jgi:hypothetical protein
MAEWNDFFVATAGASAALTGLIFVGVSISLSRILSIAGLPDRALLSLVLLLNVLVISLLFLVPEFTTKTQGGFILAVSLLVWIIIFRLDLGSIRSKHKQYKKQYLLNMLIDQVATLLFIITGFLLATGCSSPMLYLVAAIIVSIIKAVMDGWVLLVEINR